MIYATPTPPPLAFPRLAPSRRLSPLPLLLLLVALLVCLAAADDGAAVSISATPHASYSSSVGVLGCKINTDRVAYWPMAVDCTNVCVKLSYAGRSVHLLRVDQSGGAYDVSYDAWNYLQTGRSATEDPIAGGGVAMTYENASAADCKGLLRSGAGGKLPLSAANSMNFLAACLGDADSWVAQHYALYNILDPLCTLGYDEKCKLDWAGGANQATCDHTLGLQAELTSAPVYNIEYPSGQKVLASTGEPVSAGVRVGRGVWRSGADGLLGLVLLPLGLLVVELLA